MHDGMRQRKDPTTFQKIFNIYKNRKEVGNSFLEST